MSTIRCIYEQEPNFPATDQHPDAVRYCIGARWVDAVGGEPTPAEIDKMLGRDPRDAIKAQLAAIDATTGSVRWIRELALGVNDIIVALQAGPLPNLPSAGTGMAKVQAVEDQAAALRKQLAALP